MRQHQGYELQRLVYAAGGGDEVPAFLLRPDDPTGAAVVVFHQHNAEWHLGMSEVAGLVGDPHQALGPLLAASGITVLAPDAIGFEDRRRTTRGTDPHPDNRSHHEREFSYRLGTGDTLARKVLDDAAVAASGLRGLDGIDPDRIGAVGHSFGGHTTLVLTAVDERIRFACVSGAAGSFQARMGSEVGIGLDQLVPDIARRSDFTTLVRCIAPRPLLLAAGEDDRYALDAGEITDDARPAFENAGAGEMLRCEIKAGGHAPTAQRHRLIVQWATTTSQPTPKGRQPGRRLPMTDTRRSDRKPIRQDPPIG